MTGGWGPYPGAPGPRGPFPPVEPGVVVGFGAVCDLGPRLERGYSFSIGEFVTLDDGRRVTLHDDLGFHGSWNSSSRSWSDEVEFRRRHPFTVEGLTRDVLIVVRADNDDCTEPGCTEDHCLLWLADLARGRGLSVSAEDLQRLPYEVVFTDEVHRWLARMRAG